MARASKDDSGKAGMSGFEEAFCFLGMIASLIGVVLLVVFIASCCIAIHNLDDNFARTRRNISDVKFQVSSNESLLRLVLDEIRDKDNDDGTVMLPSGTLMFDDNVVFTYKGEE